MSMPSAVADLAPPRVDAITAEVIAHRFKAASEEMMATLVKTSYSPNIKERRDCSTGIFDAQGRLLALTAIAPLHLSSLLETVANVFRRFPAETMRPGDAFVVNDPYNGGGSHLPDITMAAPVFRDGKIVAFVTNLAHHSDVGGKVAGSESSDCTSIFQEGIRLPPVRIVAQGEVCDDVLQIILLNSRTPRERQGDLKAQIATNIVGYRRVEEIFDRFGTQATLDAIEAWLDYGEARARKGISELPSGVYENEDYIDHDGIEPRLVRAKVKVTVAGDKLTFDFTGSDAQMAGSRNMVMNATLAGVYYAVKALIDPDLPPNAGYFRAVEVIAPKGSIFNAQSPAGVGDRGSTGNVIGDVIFGAFAKAVPERVMAGCGPLHAITFSGTDPRRGDYFVNYETYAGASGAQFDQDGKDAVRVHVSGAANLPVEAAEHEFPLSILRYELITDSGGAGKFRGGLGTLREVVNFAQDGRLVGRGLRQKVGAPGLAGGKTGRTGRFLLDPGTPQEKQLPANYSEFPIAQGQSVRIETPAGAGFGDPRSRDPQRVLADVIAEKVSVGAARELYGVAISGSGRGATIDAAETAKLRGSHAAG
ncbi:MAG TPA: hydantoinase B/oxoprolinase family protein [Pseudolabrys sp.]|nr:hydantoinase B/oxoprolinase family protein [Pseudolabrys sp.]